MPVARYWERYTVEDHRLWEGDWELIDGMPLAMAPSPGLTHQRTAARMFAQLAAALEACPGCEALFETDVELSRDTVVRPDLLVLCHTPEGERLTRAPELIVEVVSPQTARRDEEAKLRLYAEEGVEHYLLVYPEARKVKAYTLVDGAYRKAADLHDETWRLELPGCTIDIDLAALWR